MTDRSIACHESGHAVAAIALGHRVNSATIRPADGDYSGVVNWQGKYAKPRHQAIVAICGPLAESWRFGTPLETALGDLGDSHSDAFQLWQACRKLAEQVGGGARVEACIRELHLDRAEKLLTPRLWQVIALEAALVERVTLNESEIREVLRMR